MRRGKQVKRGEEKEVRTTLHGISIAFILRFLVERICGSLPKQ
jgi:hypothetical protein